VDTPVNHSDFEQLAAGYVLGALEPADEHAFQRHLDGCAQCEASVRELEEVVGELAYAAPPVDPPATLWASIRREVRPERRRPQPRPAGAEAWPSGVQRRPRRAVRPLLARLAAAAAIVALAALSVWNLNLRDQNASYRNEVAALEQAARLLNEPNASRIALRGRTTDAQATVVASSPQDRGVLIVENLPPLQRGRVYELWGIPERGRGTPQKAVVFLPLRRQGVQTYEFGVPIQPGTVFAITDEPGPRGSERPTTEPIMSGEPQTV
jgi:anti-sigma-K factor RskA